MTASLIESPATVLATSEVAEVLCTSAKLIGAAAIAKSNGTTPAIVRAMHRGAASAAIAAAVSGKGHAAASAAALAAAIPACLNPSGVDFHRVATVCTAMVSTHFAVEYRETILANGTRSLKKSEFERVIAQIQGYARNLGRTGKPTPSALIAQTAVKFIGAVNAANLQRTAGL